MFKPVSFRYIPITRAARIERIEKAAASRKSRTKQLELEAMEEQARTLAEYKKQQDTVVAKLNKEANKKLSEANDKTKKLTTKIKDVNEQRLMERTEAVLELKANVDAVRAEVATLADKHVRKVEKAKKQLEDEKESM